MGLRRNQKENKKRTLWNQIHTHHIKTYLGQLKESKEGVYNSKHLHYEIIEI